MSSAPDRPGGDQDYAERAARYEQQTGYPMDEREARRVAEEAGGVGVWTGRLLAGTLLILNGLLGFAAGIAVIRNPSFYPVTSRYLLRWTASSWGWTELAIGIVVFAAGVGVLLGMLWARVVGIMVAAFAAIGAFMFLPYYPVWAIILVAIDVFIIWALAADRQRPRVA
jgi:hypothetical protein